MFARICLPLFALPIFFPALFPAFSGQHTFHNRGPLKQSQDPELRKTLYTIEDPIIKGGVTLPFSG